MLNSREQSSTAPARAPAMEHRWGARLPCQLRVRVSARGRYIGIGHLRNVSMTGAFLETLIELPPLAHLVLTIIPDAAHSQRATGIHADVARIARDGAGLEWSEPAAGSICALLGCTTRCAEPRSVVPRASADGSAR